MELVVTLKTQEISETARECEQQAQEIILPEDRLQTWLNTALAFVGQCNEPDPLGPIRHASDSGQLRQPR